MPLNIVPLEGRFFNRFLSTNGDGTGTVNAIGDFSGAPVDFFIEPQGNESLILNQTIIHIEDTGSMDAGFYGNDITLTNGIEVFITQGTIVLDNLTAPFPIFTNGDWGRFAFEIVITDFGAGTNFVHVLFTFSGSKPTLLPGQQLRIRLNDDFTGLVSHSFLAQGAVI